MTRTARRYFWLGLVLRCTQSYALDANQQSLAPLSSADGKQTSASTLSVASVEAGTSDSKATLSLAGFTPRPLLGDYSVVQVGGEAPVSKGGDSDTETDIGSVSGLTAGASAHASLSAYWWPHQPKTVSNQRDEICKREFPLLIEGFQFDDAPLSNVFVACGRSLFDTKMLQSIADGFNAAIKQCQQIASGKKKRPPAAPAAAAAADKGNDGSPIPSVSDCSDLKKLPVAAKLSPEASNPAYLRTLVREIDQIQNTGRAIVTVFTIGTTANRQKVSFFNRSDLTTLIKDHETGYGLNATLSGIWRTFLLSGGLSYEKTFKSVDSVQLCSPAVSGSTTLKCLSGTIGEPPGMYSRIAFFESRVLISFGGLAVAPRVEYDFTASKFGAKVPVYFAPDSKKALVGGVTVGWTTKDHFGATVFVGKAFSFF